MPATASTSPLPHARPRSRAWTFAASALLGAALGLSALADGETVVLEKAEVRDPGMDGMAESDLVGTWSGTGTDTAQDGSEVTFPLSLRITESRSGALTARFSATVPYPVGPGQTVEVALRGRFTGRGAPSGQLELQAPDVTATANGERQSLGPQTLRLERTGAGRLKGSLGTDREGWAPFELAKEGDEPEDGDGGGGDGGGGGDRRGRGEERGSTGTKPTAVAAPVGTVELVKAEVRDPGMDGMVSHTLLKPKGWTVDGGMHWTPQAYRDFVHLDLRVRAGDGRELTVYPGGFYEDSNVYEVMQQMGGLAQRPPPGQVLQNGLTNMPLPQNAADYVTRVLLPRKRPAMRDVRVVESVPLPELKSALDQMTADLRRNMEQGDEQLRQMGSNVRSSFQTAADRVRVAYTEEGSAFEEDVWVLMTIRHETQQMQGMPPTWTVHWNALDSRGVRAPAGQLDAARPLLEAVSLSLRQEPRYAAVIMDLQHKINMQQLDALARRGEIARRGREEAWRIHQAGVEERQASSDRMQAKFVDYLRDVDDFKDLDGASVKLPSLYDRVYSNGEGGYILTSEPTFDPNDHSKTEVWKRIDPER